MSKPRKKYQGPKYVARNPMATFFGGMSGEHAEHLQKLNLLNHGALSALAQGRGDRDGWDRLVGAINMANVMCEQGIGNEFRDQALAARDALCEVGKRAMKTGRFICRGDELRTISEAMGCHDAQLENVRAIDVDRASNEVLRRIREGINTTNVRAELAKEMAHEQN
jgi:hypothetical protein